MRNLFIFIWKNHFLFLFLLLESLSFYFIVRNNYFHRSSFINSSNRISGNILSAYESVNYYFSLGTANQQLALENAQLKNKLTSSFIIDKINKKSIVDSVYKQKYEYIVAKVINNSTNRATNYLTLDKGSKHGIKEDMGVVLGNGVVGIVKNVSENFSSVMSLLHKDVTVNAKIKKDGSFGPLVWKEGDDYMHATLTDIPIHVRLKGGDTVTTSSYSSIFPENIMIGTVESFFRRSGDYFFTVKVRLSADFKKIHYVYVVNNLMKEEQVKLENMSQNDK